MEFQVEDSCLSNASEKSPLTLDVLLSDLRKIGVEHEKQGDDLAPANPSWLAWLGLVLFGLSWILTLVESFKPQGWLRYAAVGLLSVGMIVGGIAIFTSAKVMVREARTVESGILDGIERNLVRWHAAIDEIRTKYSQDQILFAQAYLTDVATQVRSRVSYLIGSLEKVGIIPLVASVALTLSSLLRNDSFAFVWCTAAVVTGGFYLISMRFVGVTYTLDRFSLILKHAAADPRPPSS